MATYSPAVTDLLENSQAIVQRLLAFRQPYDSLRDELYRHYLSRSEPQFYPDNVTPRSSTFVPYPYANVRQMRGIMYEALFGIEPFFEVLPRGARDTAAALHMQRIMELKLEEARFKKAIDEFNGGLCVYGFQALDVGWDWGYDILPAMEPQPMMDQFGQPMLFPGTMQPMQQLVPVDKKIPRMRPKFETIDIYDLLVDPDGQHLVRLFDKTLNQMIREAEVNPTLYDPGALFDLAKHFESRGLDPASALIHMASIWEADTGSCTVITCKEDEASLSYKDQRYAYRAANYQAYRVTAEAPAMVLHQPYHPYLHRRVPILYTSYDKLPGEIFGIGVIEPSFNLVESLNRFVNAITDNWDLTVNRRLFVDATRVLDWTELQENNVPGGIMPTQGDPSGIVMPFELSPPDAGSYAILPLHQQMIEVASGVADFYQRGVGTPQGNKTASGINAVITQANRPQGLLVRRLEDDIILPALQLTASMIQENITDEMEYRATDEMPTIPKINSQFVRVTPEELKGSLDFRLVGPTYMENPFVQQNNMLRLTQVLKGHPYLKPLDYALELLRVFRVPYPGRLLYTHEEAAAIQQYQQQQISAAEQGAGAPSSGQPRIYGPAPVTGEVRNFAQQNGANATQGSFTDAALSETGTMAG